MSRFWCQFAFCASLFVASMLVGPEAFAQSTDPFAPAATAGTQFVAFAIWGVRILAFIAVLWLAVPIMFKRFDWLKAVGVVVGILLIFTAEPLVNWFAGISDTASTNTAIQAIGGNSYKPPTASSGR